jgi:hypothetical protein
MKVELYLQDIGSIKHLQDMLEKEAIHRALLELMSTKVIADYDADDNVPVRSLNYTHNTFTSKAISRSVFALNGAATNKYAYALNQAEQMRNMRELMQYNQDDVR